MATVLGSRFHRDVLQPRAEPRVTKPVAAQRPDPAPTSSPFSQAELARFHEEDAEAGGNVGRILCTMFTYSVFIMLVVIWWTFRTVGN